MPGLVPLRPKLGHVVAASCHRTVRRLIGDRTRLSCPASRMQVDAPVPSSHLCFSPQPKRLMSATEGRNTSAVTFFRRTDSVRSPVGNLFYVVPSGAWLRSGGYDSS